MIEQSWSRTAIISASVAIVLAAAMPHTVEAAAYSNDRFVAGPGHQFTSFDAPAKVERDPTDDGSIIIECVALGEHAIDASGISRLRLTSVPRYPLGPSKCWTPEHKGIS